MDTPRPSSRLALALCKSEIISWVTPRTRRKPKVTGIWEGNFRKKALRVQIVPGLEIGVCFRASVLHSLEILPVVGGIAETIE